MSVASVELLRAAASGDLNRLRALLVQGVDVNSTNKAHQTALMLAAAFKRIEIVEYLVFVGADVNVQDELGLTAADWARQDTRIIQLINDPSLSSGPPTAVVHTNRQQAPSLGRLTGSINRDHASVNSAVGAAVARETPVIPEPVSIANEETVDRTLMAARPTLADDDTLAPAASAGTGARVSPRDVVSRSVRELVKTASRLDIPLPQVPPMSPAMRTMLRVSIVVLLGVGAYGTYQFVTFFLGTRTSSDVKPDSASAPVNEVTKPTPAVSGELAGTELFLPDPEYPPDATVATGNVTVGIKVSRKGIVVKAHALDGDKSLRSAAEKAALSSAFAPEKLKDKGSLIDGTITYNFVKPPESKSQAPDFGFLTDATTPTNVSATAGGPLAGAERKLAIPKIPKNMRIEQKSATIVVRVSRAGKVMSWRPLEGDARFRSYLIKAARSSTFDPAKLPSETPVVGFITYKFQ